MRIITLEEHFADPAVVAASAPEIKRLAPDFTAASDPARGLSYSPGAGILRDLGDGRLADIDAGGVTMQVLEQADLTEEAKAAIAHGNTERLLGLT
jgi:hypothetical protein